MNGPRLKLGDLVMFRHLYDDPFKTLGIVIFIEKPTHKNLSTNLFVEVLMFEGPRFMRIQRWMFELEHARET